MEILALLLFSVGFKGVSAIAGIFLVGGGYLGYRYGSYVEKKAQAALSAAGKAASGASSKV